MPVPAGSDAWAVPSSGRQREAAADPEGAAPTHIWNPPAAVPAPALSQGASGPGPSGVPWGKGSARHAGIRLERQGGNVSQWEEGQMAHSQP